MRRVPPLRGSQRIFGNGLRSVGLRLRLHKGAAARLGGIYGLRSRRLTPTATQGRGCAAQAGCFDDHEDGLHSRLEEGSAAPVGRNKIETPKLAAQRRDFVAVAVRPR